VDNESPTMDKHLTACTGSGWNGVNFLHRIPYGAVFQICDWNR